MLVHIGLSLFSYATLIIAALYALQLAWIDYQLKNKKLAFSSEMPPLMSIERKMFHITQVGVVLLTLTLCSGLFYMHNLFSSENIDKAVLSIIACSSISSCCGGTIMKVARTSCGLVQRRWRRSADAGLFW
ncbi:CcsA-like protein [Klebsiella pneumoniae]|nr:CcsA-like protein [Klebsiella pneumoniae]